MRIVVLLQTQPQTLIVSSTIRQSLKGMSQTYDKNQNNKHYCSPDQTKF